MIRYRANWVLPISRPPIRQGAVVIDGGRIVSVGPTLAPGRTEFALEDVDLGAVAVLPGLVNAHTHLELSYLRDTANTSDEFVGWLKRIIARRRERTDARAPEILEGIHAAIREAVSCGTAAVGDISNTLVSFQPLVASSLAALVFYELIRFRAADADQVADDACAALGRLPATSRVRVSLAAHAPYSVSPQLFRAIYRADPFSTAPVSVHLAESQAECEFVRTAGGPLRGLLEEVGAWDPVWTAPGGSPVDFLARCGFLDARVLAVHGVHMTADDLARLAACGATLVTCPRSNRQTGAGTPPIERFYASGVQVAVGTDSLASTPDLNLFAELAALRVAAPQVPAAQLLASATNIGARALGFAEELGTIEPGKSDRLIAVEVPAACEDVEEYLVSGIEPDQIRWLAAP